MKLLASDRALAFAFAGALAVLNALADPILSSLRDAGLFGTLISLAGVSAVIWFALFAVLRIALEPVALEAAAWHRADMAALMSILALTLFPAPWPATLAVFAAGAWLFATADGNRSRRVALVLLALSGPLLWGRVILTLFAPVLLALDGHIVGALAGTAATGNTVGFVGNGARFIIGGPCSSVHNISLAILLWSSIIALLDLRVDRPLIIAGVVAMAGMFALNIVRLTAIAYFPADFDSLHLGTGATLFSWAGLLLAGLIVGGGAYAAIDRQR